MPARKRRTPASHPDATTDYAQRVVTGKIVAGPHVRDTCARHLKDIEDGHKRGLAFDTAAARRVFEFFERFLCLAAGKHENRPFVLEPSQAFIVGSLFGWKRADGTRRFREAFVEEGKGNGKSPLAGGIGLYMMVGDKEPRAEVYAAATKKDQAMVLFRAAVAMVDQSPDLRRRIVQSGTRENVWNLAYPAASSFFRPIGSDDNQSGPLVHCGLIDEVHEHKDRTVIDMMEAGQKGRTQPLLFEITNSGVNRSSICWEKHQHAIKVASGVFRDDRFFSYVCALDEGDDPFTDPKCWVKANPLLGITIRKDYLAERVNGCLGMPGNESNVRRLNFCQWTDAENPCIDGDLWRAACVPTVVIEKLRGRRLWLALDLGAKRDLTAMAGAWEDGEGGLDSIAWFWTPKDTLEERERRDQAPYQLWCDEGHLIAVPGRSVDYGYVARQVAELSAEHDIAGLAFDQWRIEDFIRELDALGIDNWIFEGADELAKKGPGQGLMMVRHGQGTGGGASEHVLWMPRSIEAWESGIMSGTLRVQPNPVMNWCVASAVQATDPAGNRKWEKRKSTGRIDGVVAQSMVAGLSAAQILTDSGDLSRYILERGVQFV